MSSDYITFYKYKSDKYFTYALAAQNTITAPTTANNTVIIPFRLIILFISINTLLISINTLFIRGINPYYLLYTREEVGVSGGGWIGEQPHFMNNLTL